MFKPFHTCSSILRSTVNYAFINFSTVNSISAIGAGSNRLLVPQSQIYIEIRERHTKRRKTHPPSFWMKRRAKFFKDYLTEENKQFVREKIFDRYSLLAANSPLKTAPWPRGEWNTESKRTGIIARKIGIYPIWKKDGTKVLTTLLQVLDNHVIRYVPPEDFANYKYVDKYKGKGYGCLVVGAVAADPQLFTPAYNGLFEEAGVIPKKKLTRFTITPDAAIQPGTPLTVNHFRVGDYVDVFGKTVGHGFQGVVKRWKFKGGPSDVRGCTKNHRRTGNIGSGREWARVWRGKKMPGHMGQERRTLAGLKIWRINTKYNVIYVHGHAVPGHVHAYVYIMDSRIKKKTPVSPHFPTFYPEETDTPMLEEYFDKDMHMFSQPSITYEDSPDDIKKQKMKTGAKIAKIAKVKK